MTGWGVERDERTASRSVIAHGGSSLMPSHSQGAERRMERRAGRTGSRWGLRALVVGGLAGAAWLLTGPAAHASGHGDPFGSVPGDVAAMTCHEPAAGALLEAAVQPPESPASQSHRRHTVLSVPVDTFAHLVHGGPEVRTAPAGTRSRIADDSPRTSGGTSDGRALPVPVEPVIEPSAEFPPDVTALVTSAGTTPVVPEPERLVDPAATPAPVPAGDTHRADVPEAGVMPAAKAKVLPRALAQRRVPAARPAPETLRTDVPGDHGPAPRWVGPGAISGIPAGRPGAPPESGSMAVLPARLVNGTVGNHRLPVTTDVEARRHDAESPTVSPD